MQTYNTNKKNYNDPIKADEVIPVAVAAEAIPFAPAIPVAAVAAEAVTVSFVQNVIPETDDNISPEAETELKKQDFSNGLIQAIAENKKAFAIRIWVVDNSGSMLTRDSKPHANLKPLRTRWAELQETVAYHAKMAAMLEAPTEFRLLNPRKGLDKFEQKIAAMREAPTEFKCGLDKFRIGFDGRENIQEDLNNALVCMQAIMPKGVRPLTERVTEIASYIHSVKDQLEANGQRAAVVLAMDGLPSGKHGVSTFTARRQFEEALKLLEGLPVWLVIRLCTNNDEMINYYNSLDANLEMSFDVLDDFNAEANEAYRCNSWLNYCLPLHRLREMGFYHKLFDLIDERPLTKDELKDFFYLIYGADALDGLPDPQMEWERFAERIATVTTNEKLQYNPVKKRMMPWVDMRRLEWAYGKDSINCNKCL